MRIDGGCYHSLEIFLSMIVVNINLNSVGFLRRVINSVSGRPIKFFLISPKRQSTYTFKVEFSV